MKHEGLHVNRLKREHNALEKAYAERWKKENLGNCPLLGQLLAKNSVCVEFSQRDATVAATIIQWLGSEVGSYFIDEVRESQK